MQTSDAAPKCQYCGSFPHQGVCPTVKAIEYHPNGMTKRVEFKTANDYPQQTLCLPSLSVGDAPARSTGNTSSAFPSLCDSGGELWDADEAS
jgi:hypothetical protein